jgi:hypothetical protein
VWEVGDRRIPLQWWAGQGFPRRKHHHKTGCPTLRGFRSVGIPAAVAERFSRLHPFAAAFFTAPPKSATARAMEKSVNLLSVIFAQVYFPTFSNRLKDIGQFLGARWTGPVTSGLQSLAYRAAWEQSLAPELKTALLAYNRDDCAATETVTSDLTQIIREAKSRADVEFSDRPKRVASDKGAEIHGSLESLQRSAHFRYERSRIKLSEENASQSLPPQRKKAKRSPRRRSFSSIKGKIVRVPRRRICPKHPGHKLSASSKISQHSLLDVIFSKTGCRKTIVRYTGLMGYCNLCNEKYAPPGTRVFRGQQFGWSFQAWVVYQRIALRMSYRLISKATFDLFSEQLSPETAVGFVERFSKYYQRTARESDVYSPLLDRLHGAG